jgi:hypothetical protein
MIMYFTWAYTSIILICNSGFLDIVHRLYFNKITVQLQMEVQKPSRSEAIAKSSPVEMNS